MEYTVTHSDQADILLVEDNPEDVELAVRAIRKTHLTNKIHVVSDGAEALEYLLAEGRYAHRRDTALPKVVFLDLKLPLVNGFEVLEQCRAQERLRRLPIVVLTSSRESQDVQRSFGLGANSYIVKPVDYQQFTTVVRDSGVYWLMINQSATG